MKTYAIIPVLALGLFANVAAAQDKPKDKPAAPPTASTPARGSELIGTNIVDAADKTIGEVQDLVVCRTSGEIVAVVDRDGGGLVCVPLAKLSPRFEAQETDAGEAPPTADVEKFVFTGDMAKFLAAESIEDSNAVDESTLKRCHEYFGTKKADSKDDKPADKSTAGADKPACVKKLIGEDVKDSAGKDVGEVKDVAVDFGSNKLSYVVISAGGTLGVGDRLVAISLDKLKKTADGKACSVPMTLETLKAGTAIDLDRLPMRPSLTSMDAGGSTTRPATASNS